MVFGQLAIAPTPFDSESIWTLTSLAHTDPTNTLPVLLGMATLANVESSRWFMTAGERAREVLANERATEKRSRGLIVIEPKKNIHVVLRLLSVVRMFAAMMIPGSMVIYWLTSAVFGLAQTWAFDWWEGRIYRTVPVVNPPVPPPTSPQVAGPPLPKQIPFTTPPPSKSARKQ